MSEMMGLHVASQKNLLPQKSPKPKKVIPSFVCNIIILYSLPSLASRQNLLRVISCDTNGQEEARIEGADRQNQAHCHETG